MRKKVLFQHVLGVQGRLQEANSFFLALAHGSFNPATITAECTALLMNAHLSHGDAGGAARVFQNLPHLPARPALSAAVVSAATEALCLGAHHILPLWKTLMRVSGPRCCCCCVQKPTVSTTWVVETQQ
jgi:hypothetical protein